MTDSEKLDHTCNVLQTMKARIANTQPENLSFVLLYFSITYILRVCVIVLERWITQYVHTLFMYLFDFHFFMPPIVPGSIGRFQSHLRVS